jgi:cullin 1
MGDSQNIIHLEEGWNNEIKSKALDPLEVMLDSGFQGKTKLFSNTEYINIYTICYNMCTQRSPYNWSEQLYQRHGETIGKYLSTHVLPVLKERHNEFLLRELVTRGDNHKIMNKWLQKFFMYLDRYYVKYHSLPTLEDAGLRHFKTLIFDIVKKDVSTALLALIDEERDGAVVDRGLIRACITLFESMGMGSLEVYTVDFEADLLSATRLVDSEPIKNQLN